MWAVSCSSGERDRRTSWERVAILPNSVRRPVANTTASPEPRNTEQPANTRLALSVIRDVSGSVVRATAFDSPVSGALLTIRSPTSTSRASAGTRSPSRTSSTSPGTNSSARISVSSPPRRTMTFCGRNLRSASMARSARNSWTKANSAFSTATPSSAQPRMAMFSPGWRWSATKQMAAEMNSRMVKKLVNWRPRLPSHQSLRSTCSELGPTSRRRSSTSSASRPSGRECRLPKTSPASRLWTWRATVSRHLPPC